MKKLMLALSAAMMLAACSDYTEEQTNEKHEKTVRFSLSNGEITQELMTRATLADMNITDLWLFDYMGDDLRKTMHKTDGFNSITMELGYGEHTICFVASRGSESTVNAPTITWEKPSDTFWTTLVIDVKPSMQGEYAVVLKRVATRLKIAITDEIPANAGKLEVKPAMWYYGLDVRTGEGVSNRDQVRTVNIPSSYIGTTGQLSASFFGLSPKTEWSTDVSVRLVSTDEQTIGEVTLPSVGFKQNLTTSYSGRIVGGLRTVGVTADDEWTQGDEQTW